LNRLLGIHIVGNNWFAINVALIGSKEGMWFKFDYFLIFKNVFDSNIQKFELL